MAWSLIIMDKKDLQTITSYNNNDSLCLICIFRIIGRNDHREVSFLIRRVFIEPSTRNARTDGPKLSSHIQLLERRAPKCNVTIELKVFVCENVNHNKNDKYQSWAVICYKKWLKKKASKMAFISFSIRAFTVLLLTSTFAQGKPKYFSC